MNGKSTASALNIAAFYCLLWGIGTEYFVVLHWDQWTKAIEGRSMGEALGYLMRGPIIGAFYIIAAIGLFQRELWGRKLATACVLLSAYPISNEVAWGWSPSGPSMQIRMWSVFIVGIWSAIWLFLLYRSSSTAALRKHA